MKRLFRRVLLAALAGFLLAGCHAGSVKPGGGGSAISEEATYFYVIGSQKEWEGDFEGAVSSYRQAMAKDPESLFLPVQLGEAILLHEGPTDEVKTLADGTLNRQPDYAPALKLLAEYYGRKRDIPRTLQVYRQVVSTNPEDLEAWLKLGSLLQTTGREDEAIAAFEQALTLNAEGFMANYYLGTIYMRRENYTKARGYFETIERTRPDFDTVHLNLGFIDEREQKWESAVRHYRAVLEANPGSRQVRERLGRVLIQSGLYENAVAEYRRLIEEDPQNVEFIFRLGMAYYDAGQAEKAEEAFRKLLEVAPAEPAAHYYLGLLYEEKNQPELAVEQYKAIIRDNPGEIRARLRLGYVLGRMERFDDAIAAYREILSINQEIPEVYLYLGSGLIQAKRYEEAMEALEIGLTLRESRDEFLFNMAVVQEKLGNFDRMVRYLRETLEINPDHVDALNYLGYSYAERGENLEEAEELITRALRLKPESGYIRDSYAWVLYQRGQYARALEEQLAAMSSVKDDPIVYDHLGDIYLKNGKLEEARKAWSRALELSPPHPEMVRRIKDKLGIP